MENHEESKEWIKRELMVAEEKDILLHALELVKEHVKSYIRLTNEGHIHLLPSARKLERQWQVYLYFVGKAYGYVAELFDEDYVRNKELETNLKSPSGEGLPSGTIRYSLKTLRDRGWIIQLSSGVHKLDYSKLNEAFKVIVKEGNDRRE